MKKSNIPTQAEYELNEAKLLQAQLRGIEAAPLSERKEAQAEFGEAMANYPALVADRISWLFNGSYGFGACRRSRQICESRGNKAAQLNQLVAALEWRCPASMAAAAWKSLTPAQKRKLASAIQAEIKTPTFAC